MKIQINLKIKANAEANSKIQLVVGADDTILGTKERIAALQPIPFSDQDLKLDGKVLVDGKRLCDYEIKEGSFLDFEVRASEATLAQQLNELLQARDLSSDELGLLYCYKHGVSINQSLNLIGHEGKFVDFLKKQKAICIENGRVALKREDTALKPFSVTDEIAQILTESGTMDIKDLKSKFVEKFNVSMASIAGMKPMEFLGKHKNTFTVNGRFVSLKGAESEPPNPKSAQQMIAPPGLEEMPVDEASHDEVDCQQYLDLHDKICGRSFNSKIAQALNNLVETVSEVSFLNISHVVKGGSVGKGTAISGVTDAEVVFFLKGLPAVGQDRWLPPLLKAVSGVLTMGGEHGVDEVCTTEDSLRMRVKGLITVDLRFSPVFDSYANIIQTLGEQGPEARKYYATSLVKERTQFIAKQPGHVKVTIRLLKWWRDQQTWSGKVFRPADEMLELVCVYSAVQTKPADQRVAIANVMALLSQANDLRIVWSNYYSKDDVWAPLLRQRPLLMDPTNPFIYIADPQSFDATELMRLAKTTHFFW